jgi:acyl-CoA hydrolase
MMPSIGRPILFDDPDQLADAVIDRVGKNIVLGLPLGLGKANHVANALFARAAVDPSISLCIFTGLTLEKPHGKSELERRFLEPLSRRIFGGYPDLAYALALHAGNLPPNIQIDEFFFQAGTRLNVPISQRSHICANYTHVLGYLVERGVNVVAQLVAKRPRDGATRLSLSCNPDITLDLLARRHQGEADFLFVGQVNSELPFMPGDPDLPASEFDLLLESQKTDFQLFAPPREPIELADYASALHAARCVADGGTLQLGIGSSGDAVVQALILRHRQNAEFVRMIAALSLGEAPVAFSHAAPFAQGVHGVSEMFVEGFLALRDAGILIREVDGTVLAAAFFLGSRGFYRALREMPDAELAKLRMTAVSFVNEIYGDEPAKRAARVKARFINNAMMATVLGDVISDGLEDGKIVSGVGGQHNFVAHAFALDGARSIIMLPTTRVAGGRVTSNIRWSYGHVTIPRHLRDVVITEYGIADLRGKSDRRVIAAMLEITDSRFQQDLLARAKAAGKIEPEYELPARCRNNTPERIEAELRPFRERGLLPRFPFGTDFTPEEQRLVPALALLRASSHERLARLAWAGWHASPGSPDVQQALARMRLDKTSSLSERFYAHLLRGALAAVDDAPSSAHSRASGNPE